MLGSLAVHSAGGQVSLAAKIAHSVPYLQLRPKRDSDGDLRTTTKKGYCQRFPAVSTKLCLNFELAAYKR